MIRTMLVLSLLGAVLAPGCRTFTRPAKTQEISDGTAHWMDYDATRRGALVLPDGSATPKVLAEPSPDAALNATLDLAAKVKGNEVSVHLAESIVELGKRTEAVMILRECLYRIGEFTNNGFLTPAQADAQYTLVLAAVKEIAIAEKTTAEAAAVQAKARITEAVTEAIKASPSDTANIIQSMAPALR